MEAEKRLNLIAQELFKEHVRMTLSRNLLPTFWSHFDQDKSSIESLQGLCTALEGLYSSLKAAIQSTEFDQLYPQILVERICPSLEVALKQLQVSVSASVPVLIYPILRDIFSTALDHYQLIRKNLDTEQEEDDQEMEDGCESQEIWSLFVRCISLLHEGGLQLLCAEPTMAVMDSKIDEYIKEHCTQEFDAPMLSDVSQELQLMLMGWIGTVFMVTDLEGVHWEEKVLKSVYQSFGKLRISELFDIIVEYPDSQAALLDLRECLKHTDLRQQVRTSLRASFEQRLLHPGANTADIITQYISSIRGLKILDSSGVILEWVCDPVRKTREDTVSCIMASLTDDSSNELAEELKQGGNVLLDLSEECDDENQDFDAWEPDPVDADPTKTSRSRKTSDIISQELFVTEYRNLLAERLLQSLDYDTTAELCNLEHLKLRFGETSLQFCEVMLKDITDSRRIDTYIQEKLPKSPNAIELHSFILSHVFWPSIQDDPIKIPECMQRDLDKYTQCYEALKGMRTLRYQHNLGLVELELEMGGRFVPFSVSPARATVMWHFQEKDTWTVEELSGIMETSPAAVRRYLGYWVGQCVIREEASDTYTLVDNFDDISDKGQDIDEGSDVAMVTSEDQKESELQMLWSYISAMLTNLGPLPLERIKMMLSMFMTEGTQKDYTSAELKAFMDRKVKEQELIVSGGNYQLNRN